MKLCHKLWTSLNLKRASLLNEFALFRSKQILRHQKTFGGNCSLKIKLNALNLKTFIQTIKKYVVNNWKIIGLTLSDRQNLVIRYSKIEIVSMTRP